jgi:glycosyltransferase involved in cell wall biosynthesis
MTEVARSILHVGSRLGRQESGGSVPSFLDRIERAGFSIQAVCLEALAEARADERVVECRGLGRRWWLPLAVRGLRFGERLRRPDLIHVVHARASEVGLAIADHWRIPYVLTVDDFVPAGGKLRISARWCRGLIATSRELAADLMLRLAVPAAMIKVVHPGIETPDAPDEKPSLRQVAVVGTSGALSAGSGIGTFLNAARRVLNAGVDAEFVVAGRGEDEVNLRRRAERLKLAERVTFAGIPVVGQRFWSVLDVFCLPSLIPSSGRPLAAAMAFGVPSIASDVEGLRALVDDGRNGLRVAPGDSEDLSRAILALLANQDLAQRLGEAARNLILRDYAPDTEAHRLAEVYREALASPSAQSSWPRRARSA